MNTQILAGVSLVAVVTLTGCGGGTSVAPAPTVTVTEAAPVAPVQAPVPQSQDYGSDEVITYEYEILAMSVAWDAMGREDQQLICELYTTAPEYAWEVFSGNTSEISQDTFDTFFKATC